MQGFSLQILIQFQNKCINAPLATKDASYIHDIEFLPGKIILFYMYLQRESYRISACEHKYSLKSNTIYCF